MIHSNTYKITLKELYQIFGEILTQEELNKLRDEIKAANKKFK